MLNWVLSILSFCLLLGGSFQSRPAPCRVVTQITVQWTESDTETHRIYTGQDKMNKLLIYLRSLDPVPQDPDSAQGDVPEYRITVQLSDGNVVRYTQLGITNFRKENEGWRSVDPEDAIRLPLILAAIPDDG